MNLHIEFVENNFLLPMTGIVRICISDSWNPERAIDAIFKALCGGHHKEGPGAHLCGAFAKLFPPKVNVSYGHLLHDDIV